MAEIDLTLYGLTEWKAFGHVWEGRAEYPTGRPPQAFPGIYCIRDTKPFGRFRGGQSDVVVVRAAKDLQASVLNEIQHIGRDSTYDYDTGLPRTSRGRLADLMSDAMTPKIAWTYALSFGGANYLAGEILSEIRETHGELPPLNDKLPRRPNASSGRRRVPTGFGTAWAENARSGVGDLLLVYASPSPRDEPIQEFVKVVGSTSDVGYRPADGSRIARLNPTGQVQFLEQAVAQTFIAAGLR